jgi:MFS family permease
MSSPSARAEGAGVTGLTLAMPLVLAQFVASYAGTNMNVAISAIADDLGTSVTGLQTTITLFTLTMAALMIPGSKLSDIWGRKRCFLLGLGIYGTGAVLASLSQGLGLMIVGYSLLQGIGSALMIPPIYILITVSFRDPRARAKWFGAVSGAAGLGAAAGPLIGGLITTTVSWRASFIVQALLVALVAFLALRIVDEGALENRPFDVVGAALSAAGLFFLVFGVLLTSTYGWGTAREASWPSACSSFSCSTATSWPGSVGATNHSWPPGSSGTRRRTSDW